MVSILLIVMGYVMAEKITHWIQPKIELDTDLHDFKTISKGDEASFYIRFTNVGRSSLNIMRVDGGCGCTVVDWSKESVAPGEKDSILVTYDSEIVGSIDRRVTIYSNGSINPRIFYIVGNVE